MNFTKCWLNYRPVNGYDQVKSILSHCYFKKASIVMDSAVKEYVTGMQTLLNEQIEVSEEDGDQGVFLTIDHSLEKESFRIVADDNKVVIAGGCENGVLYGVFELLRKMEMNIPYDQFSDEQKQTMKLRMVNHWDNMAGDIERGYSGESFFFKDNEILFDERTVMYTRLMASIGVNAIVINNVNVHHHETYLITDRYLSQVKQYADLFASYGIKLMMSVNFAAPMELSDIDVADPLDERVINWWNNAVDHIYEVIPNFGGFLVKADSEGRPGPFTYNRTHSDGANMLAKALKPHGGLVIWRCFVYNCGQDWRDRKTDRARAAYDNFMPLDGQFMDNVILQIKNGPMDFQVREPVSPLFGGLKKTNQMLEVQVAQEYTGQQKHVCYLLPMWKEILEFNTYANNLNTTVADVVSGKAYQQTNCGMTGVINTGNDENWTGHDLAAANLYGLGRLMFTSSLSSEEIADEWICMTFSSDKKVRETICAILMNSWPIYEKYTSPLGIGWMVTPHYHYGPDVDGYEYDRWGTYHRADRNGLGVDRTTKGTGYTMQYNEPIASQYNEVSTCPEELLLFFHYIRYDYRLSSGQTLIQYIYSTHFEGVENVEHMMEQWQSLKGCIEEDAFNRVTERMNIQHESAIEWRDRINTYFYRKSGVKDELGRLIYE